MGIKKMLHLIWTKENTTSTTEDSKEVKGIRSRLLECYRNLYFDALPDMNPKDQVNRIAKNMVEFVFSLSFLKQMSKLSFRLTYDATLAELTSLEEMMRIMMDEGYVHQDIISKLWQIYSKS
jgi:condensin complex subunit 1